MKNDKKSYWDGYTDGRKSAENYSKKSELEKWASDFNDVAFGSGRTKGSESYEAGRREGKKDYYKGR